MSESQEQVTETPVIAADAPAADIQQDAPQSPSPRAQIEAAAKNSGWSPKDQWKGPEEDWVDAPDFILKAVGEVLPTMRKSLNDTKADLKAMQTTLAKTVATAYSRALADLKAEQRAAVQAGDEAAVEEITERIADLRAAPPSNDDFQSKFEAWKSENAWYESDPDMQAFAFGVGQELAAKDVPPDKQLVEVTKRVKAAFPHKFENPRRREPSAVEGVTQTRRAAGKTFSDLPPDAKQMVAEFKRDIPSFNVDRYVKDFFANGN